MNDAQWLAMIDYFTPSDRLIGMLNDSVAIRRPDGTGALVSPTGEITEIDAEGNPVAGGAA